MTRAIHLDSGPRLRPIDDEPHDRPQLSVVVPLFDEEATLPDLYHRLSCALDRLGVSYELLFVDDGSTDRTPEMLGELVAADRRVVVLQLTRNFGHQAAVSAGLMHSRGDAVAVMDGDLQDPPEVLGGFVERWREGFDVVYAIRTKRKEGPIKRLAYHLFYRLLRAVADLRIPLDSGDFCLMDRRVADALNQLPERQRFVRGLRSFVGFRQTGLEYEREARAAGTSKYTFRKLVGLALDGVINFSSLPMRVAIIPGLLGLAGGMAIGLTSAIEAILTASDPRGWTIVLAAVLALGGLQLIGLGIAGEYIRRIFLEVKGRPAYIVGEVKQRCEVRGVRSEVNQRAG